MNGSRYWLATCVLSVLGVASAAGAQAPVAEPTANGGETTGGIEEIVVTAQKRSENLQSVPVAVTAITPALIRNARIENIADLRSVAPNLYVVTQSGGSSIPATTMRGQVSGAASDPTVDNGISYYIDGVYLGALTGIIFDVADIERIEVIRGPAGTLFGTNSTGGAINYITSGPKGKFGLAEDLTYSRFGSFRTKTRIDTPSWNGLSAAVSYLQNEKRNNVRNFRRTTIDYSGNTAGRVGRLTSAKDLGESTTDAVHAVARWEPLSDLTLEYKFDWAKQRQSPLASYLLGFPDGPGGVAAYQLVASQAFFGGPSIGDYIQTKRGRVAFNDNTVPFTSKTTSHLVTAQYRATDWLSIKNSTSWRTLDRTPYTSNLDGTGFLTIPIAFGANGAPTAFAPFGLLTVRCCENLRQFSDELQFNVDTRRFDLTAGLYYYTRRNERGGNPFGEQTTDAFQVYPGNAHPGTPISDFSSSYYYRVRQTAGYGQATFHLTDTVDITGGIRYTQDHKTFFDTSAGPPGTTYRYSKGNFSYLGNVSFKPTDNVLGYVKYVTSFIAGGTSAGALARDSVTGNTFQGPAIPYGEERAKSWEAGIKAEWLDRRLRTNFALFHVDYRNLQTPIFASSGCITSPSGLCEPIVSSSYTTNFGKARAYGVEYEITAVPFEGLTLTAGGSYTDFDYKAISPLVLATSPVTRVQDYPETLRPKVLTNLAADYLMPLSGDVKLQLRVDGAYRSAVSVTTSRFSSAGFAAAGIPYDNSYLNDLGRQKKLFTLNARATVLDLPLAGAKVAVSLWGRNITNRQQLNFIGNTGITAGGLFDDPVTYGVDLSARF